MNSTDPNRIHSARYIGYVIALLTVVNVFNYMDRMALAVLLPFIKTDLELSDGQLGLLVGFAFSLFYAVCGIPIARFADRGVRRNIIAVALTVWSAMTALSGVAQNFWHLFAARIGVGAGEAGCLPPAQSMLCDYVPLKRRSGVFAVHNFGIIAGLMLGMALAGWLGETIGWRWAFVALGLPGIALAIIIRFTLREPIRGGLDAVKNGEGTRLPLGRTLAILWQCKTYRLLTLLYALNGFMQYGLHQWWPSFYTRTFGLTPAAAGVKLGLAIGVGAGIGLLLGGLLANPMAQRDTRLPLMMGVAASVLAAPTALGTLWLPSAGGSIGLVSLTALLWNVSTGAVVAAATSVVSPQMRATAGAIHILCAAVLGFGLGPLCVGLLSDLLMPSLGVQSLRYALLLPICLLPVMALVFYASAQALPKDLKAAASD